MSIRNRAVQLGQRGLESLSREMRYKEQYAYGHSEILKNYAGIPSTSTLLGRVQHGWDHNGSEPSGAFRPYGWKESWQWLWTKRAVQRGKSRGAKKVTAIGAPWLYLIQGVTHESTREIGDRHPLIMPAHRNDLSTPKHHSAFVHSLRDCVQPDKAVVLLHGLDFMRSDIRKVYSSLGFQVDSAGWPLLPHPPRMPSSSIGDRVKFLHNLLHIMRNSSVLITESMGSHVLYAGAIKLETVIWPSQTEISGQPGEISQRTVALSNDLQSIQHWQANRLYSFLRQPIPTHLMEDLVSEFLGPESVRSPRELRELLRWSD